MTRVPTRSLLLAAALVFGQGAGSPAARAQAGAPEPVTLRAEALACARTQLGSGDARLRTALDRLVEEADLALIQGPWSVVQDTLMPPSGDRHDYMSVAPGYWPDPSKPDGLPYVWRDGVINRALIEGTDSDHRPKMSGAVQTLALAHYFTGRREYAERAALLIRTWFLDPATRMNPHLRYAQAVRGVNTGRASGVLDAHDFIPVLDAVALIAPSGAWTADDQAGMERWSRELLDWILTSDFGQRERRTSNNHSTWADATVASLALFVGDTALARRTVEESRTLRIAKQILPDGSQPEELRRTRTFTYSIFNLRAFSTLAEVGRRVGVDLWGYTSPDGRGIRAAIDFLAPYADPTRRWPHEQITPISRVDLLPFLRLARMAYREPRYLQLAEKIRDPGTRGHRAWLLYPHGCTPGVSLKLEQRAAE